MDQYFKIKHWTLTVCSFFFFFFWPLTSNIRLKVHFKQIIITLPPIPAIVWLLWPLTSVQRSLFATSALKEVKQTEPQRPLTAVWPHFVHLNAEFNDFIQYKPTVPCSGGEWQLVVVLQSAGEGNPQVTRRGAVVSPETEPSATFSFLLCLNTLSLSDFCF